MPEVTLNYLAMLVAVAANMGLGFLWYSPLLFAKPWMELMGYTEKSIKEAQKKMGPMYGLSALAALVTAYVLSHIIDYVQAVNVVSGMQTGFWVWIGFVAPVQMTEVLFSGKPWKLYFINTGYQLTALLVMGAILAVWA